MICCAYMYNTGSEGQTVLLVTVPNFDLTHSCVLVNLTTLECQEGETMGDDQLEPEMSILHHMDMEKEEED